MSLDILDAISKLAPIITNAAKSAGAAQDTNAVIGNNAADNRPGIVAKNMSNARIASMMKGYTKPTLNWGGPGSVANGQIPTMSGGPGADTPEMSALYDQVSKDALNQANTNYGIKDPSASSPGTDAMGAAGTGLSILGALKSLVPKGGSAPSSGSGQTGPGTPGTFGTGAGESGNNLNPSNVGTPYGIRGEGPNDITGIGPEQIELLRRLGLGVGGSSHEPGGAGEGSAQTVGYV